MYNLTNSSTITREGRTEVKRKIMCVILACTMLASMFTFTGCGSGKDGVKRLKLSINTNESQVDMAEAMAEKIKELSGGKMEIDIYGDGQLGGDREVAETVQYGNIDMCVVSTTPVAAFYPDLNLFDAPFLFNDSEQAQEILDGEIGTQIAEGMEDIGFKVLGFPENGFRQLSTANTEVHSPADLKGLKIRVMESEVHIATWKALGANPTPMAFSELFTALQQKTVDGQDNPFVTDRDNRYYEVQNYIIETNHVYTPYLLLMSKDSFDKLTEEEQKIVEEVGKYGVEVQREKTAEYDEDAVVDMQDKGVTLITLTDDEKQQFRDAVADIYPLVKEKMTHPELFDQVLELTQEGGSEQ